MPKPAAQVLLERYWEEVNNLGKLELIRELCSDPITRHDPGGVTVLSHDEQIERVRVGIEQPVFCPRCGKPIEGISLDEYVSWDDPRCPDCRERA